MCLIALMHRVVEGWPLIFGANREEDYARGGEPPMLWPTKPQFIAGRDPIGGGTWLGVNAHGVLIAITNRRRSEQPAQPRSRGLLVTYLLACDHFSSAEALGIRELSTHHYAGCNVLIADGERATVIHHGDWMRVKPLPPGIHILANRDVNDESDRRSRYAYEMLASQRYPDVDVALLALQAVCSHHQSPTPICLNGDNRGTVSSTLIGLTKPLQNSRLHHAQGPPDRAVYFDRSDLFTELIQEPT